MSTFIYHSGQLQYSHKEFPEQPSESSFGENFGDSTLFDASGYERAMNDYDIELKSFYASLLPVVNPEVAENIIRINSRDMSEFKEGDHWPVPDGVEVTGCVTCRCDTSIERGVPMMCFYCAGKYKAVRLSIKAPI